MSQAKSGEILSELKYFTNGMRSTSGNLWMICRLQE